MSKQTYIKTESITTKFEIIMPSGNLLKISLYPETAKEDVEFVERLVKLACDMEPKP